MSRIWFTIGCMTFAFVAAMWHGCQRENADRLDYNLHVKPILSDKCFACHGPDGARREAGLRLDQSESAYAELIDNPGNHAIVPGRSKSSVLIQRITSSDQQVVMPPPDSGLKLKEEEKEILTRWINQGAKYKRHWAFVPIESPDLPDAASAWVRNPIDHYILEKLNAEGLKPSAPANKQLLLRRVYLDLIGLPPTADQIRSFIEDDRPTAYEQVVDSLLMSPHYGEMMATGWMDVARFADTHGYTVDRYRDMSPWRDWVIKAYNDNMPYDEFLTWQLAGDLLPNATRDQILATGFNRLHPQNLEGGIVDEEFRVAYVADRTDVLGAGLMGLTVACAKCHDHKYDPISQKDYYELYSFFNNVNESGQISWNDATPVPTLQLPTEKQEEILAFLSKEVSMEEGELKTFQENHQEEFQAWVDGEAYRDAQISLSDGLQAIFDFEGSSLRNRVGGGKDARMDRQHSKQEFPVFAQGEQGQGLVLDGDAWLDCNPVGIFRRSDPFTIAISAYVPSGLSTGVFFHKCQGARLHAFRGYHLMLRDGKLEAMLSHTWPDNAIVKYSIEDVPTDQWVKLVMTYDGSSSASGLQIYLNGRELATRIEVDNLYRDIVFNGTHDDIYDGKREPGLQVGGRWRGKGLGGATVDNIRVYNRRLTSLEVLRLDSKAAASTFLQKSPKGLSNSEQKALGEYYFEVLSPAYRSLLVKLVATRQAKNKASESVQEIMVMKEMDQPRQTYVLERGLYDTYGDKVSPSVLDMLAKFPDNQPLNRLGLAKWLTSPEHPLTARVVVNRYWQKFFGRGLVETTEDFGSQGARPSHPMLIDWLAHRLIESGWDLKGLQKLIVMSATYRQDSKASPDLRNKDPHNVLLARGPSVRLTSEMIRDNALKASGLINLKIGGKSVKPYQPEGLWRMNSATYVQDTGDLVYRRSLYTFWKRSVPHPTLSTFDQPDRSECTMRRQKTNTPLQALVLLNDPAFIEASRAMGEQLAQAQDIVKALEDAFLSLTGRLPTVKETDLLLKAQQREYQLLVENPEKSEGWLNLGQYEVSEDRDPLLVAANSIVAHTIMNSDAAITKR